MRFTSVIVLALLACASAAVLPDSQRKLADKETLTKQKNILQLLIRVQQPLYCKELLEIGKNYQLEQNIDKYTDQTVVRTFLNLIQKEHNIILLNCKAEFNVMRQEHMDQARWVFDLLYTAKDFDTFLKTACWLRMRINPAVFTYTFIMAVVQRTDTQDLMVPPPYEIFPQLFVRTEIIQRAFQAKMRGVQSYKDICDIVNDKTCILMANHNRSNIWYPDEKMRYLTEDIGLNGLYFNWHMEHPFWLTGKEHKIKMEHRGELFLYFHRQILARYVLERIGNGLGEVEPVHLWDHVRESYAPKLRQLNGKEMPARMTNTRLIDTVDFSVSDLYNYEKRIIDAIDAGIVFSKTGQKHELISPKGINILGEMIMGLPDSMNRPYYGAIYNHLRLLAGGLVDPANRNKLSPGALHYFSTSLRDPLYYRLIQRINDLWERYVERLGPYTKEELLVPGIKIETVEIDKLITYFDHFDVALNNVVDVANEEDAKKVDILTRMFRLNHMPFTFRIGLNSDKATNVLVRIFLGPKLDQHGMEILLEERYKYYVELDRFPTKVEVGKNMIERTSRQSTVSIPDMTTFTDLLTHVNEALEGKKEFYLDKTHRTCGYPDRLILPRGRKSGQMYSLFVLVSEFDKSDVTEMEFQSLPLCGPVHNGVWVDNKPAGFPFNRPIKKDEMQWSIMVPNSLFKDVVIFHKKQEEINRPEDI